VITFVWLGWLGMQSGSALQTILARVFTMYYFAFFALMPIWTRLDSYKPVPERIPEHD
jgi:ubiquinol-cytochrome c reductase cytochrome b subunit